MVHLHHQPGAPKRPGIKMDRLPLRRVDDSGHLQLSGYGTVNLEIDYRDVLGTGGHGVVFRGRIFNLDGSLVMEVRIYQERNVFST